MSGRRRVPWSGWSVRSARPARRARPRRLPPDRLRRFRPRAAVRGLRLLGVYVAQFEIPVLLAALRARALGRRDLTAPESERLLTRLAHRLFTDGFRRAGITLDTSDGLPMPAPGRPVVMFLRHSGPLNFQLGALLVCHLLERSLLSVGRSLPGRDPAVGLLLRPLKVDLIRWEESGPVRAMRLLIRHSRDLTPHEVLAYFPEGVNMTSAGRHRALAALDHADPQRARWARQLRYVLPPVSAGAARVLGEAKDADVLVVGHTGLEDLLAGTVDIGYPPRADGHDHRVHLTWWHTPAEDVPRTPGAAAAWLDGQWTVMDTWIAHKRQAGADAGPGPDTDAGPDAAPRPGSAHPGPPVAAATLTPVPPKPHPSRSPQS
ncbi:hypothetical protein [Streptomyces sp. NPDC051561]|uniref:hypothetical protein n=1 Tax=Streptomyces sp. NPDC051561 TaxID=3365658 RepID=UPI0037A2817B